MNPETNNIHALNINVNTPTQAHINASLVSITHRAPTLSQRAHTPEARL